MNWIYVLGGLVALALLCMAAGGILALGAVDVVGEEPAVLVGGVVALRSAEGRHLDRFRADVHMDQPEAPADEIGPAEQRLDRFRFGVGRDIEVLGRNAEKEIADGAAHDEGLEAGLLQPADHLIGRTRQLLAAHRMVFGPIDARRLGAFGTAGNQACEQAADHGRDRARARSEAAANDGKGGAQPAQAEGTGKRINIIACSCRPARGARRQLPVRRGSTG